MQITSSTRVELDRELDKLIEFIIESGKILGVLEILYHDHTSSIHYFLTNEMPRIRTL